MQIRSGAPWTTRSTAPPDEDREIMVEEARVQGWTPAGDSKGVEETPTRYRHKISARKGMTTKASFAVERLDSESVVLTEMTSTAC